MTREEIICLARQKAIKYGLDGNLVCAIIEQESDFDQYAIRSEPAFYVRYIEPLRESQHLGPTEAICRSMSWGLAQIMGQTAREQGFGGLYLSELCDVAVNLEVACKFFSSLLGKTGNDVTLALARYNGGGNPYYPDQVKARIQTFT